MSPFGFSLSALAVSVEFLPISLGTPFPALETTATVEAMSRQADPFDDILQPQPRHPQQSTVADNPFDQDASPNLFDDHNGAYGGHASSGHTASSSRDAGRQHGYALDPFFDE